MLLRCLVKPRGDGTIKFELAGATYTVGDSRTVEVPDEWALGLIETGNFEQVATDSVLMPMAEGCPDDEVPVVKKGRKAKQA